MEMWMNSAIALDTHAHTIHLWMSILRKDHSTRKTIQMLVDTNPGVTIPSYSFGFADIESAPHAHGHYLLHQACISI